MKVLFVLHQFLPRHVTGTEQYARSLALGLKARGHEVRVFAFAPLIQFDAPGKLWFARDETVDGIAVRRVSVHPDAQPNPWLADFDNPLGGELLQRYLDEQDTPFELVHVFHARNIGVDATAAASARGIPVTVHLMDFWFLCPNFMLLRRSGELCDGPPDGGLGCVACLDPELGRWLEASGLHRELRSLADDPSVVCGRITGQAARVLALQQRPTRSKAILQRANAVLAPSRFLRDKFIAAGFSAMQLRHMPYGVDRTRLAGLLPRDRADEFVVGFIGSLAPHKGLHVLVKALRQCDSRQLRLRIHGDPRTHLQYAEEIRQLAGDDPRIELCGAFAPEDLGRVLTRLDCICVPSLWYENTPFTALEALAGRRPVLASNLGGIAEIVQDGVNGLLFPPGNVDALAQCITRLSGDRELMAKLCAAPEPRTLDANLDDFESLYQELTATSPKP